MRTPHAFPVVLGGLLGSTRTAGTDVLRAVRMTGRALTRSGVTHRPDNPPNPTTTLTERPFGRGFLVTLGANPRCRFAAANRSGGPNEGQGRSVSVVPGRRLHPVGHPAVTGESLCGAADHLPQWPRKTSGVHTDERTEGKAVGGR